jgi:hypothetical protein
MGERLSAPSCGKELDSGAGIPERIPARTSCLLVTRRQPVRDSVA